MPGYARGAPYRPRRRPAARYATTRKRTYSGSGMYTGQGAYSVKKFVAGVKRFGNNKIVQGIGRAVLDTVPYGSTIRKGLHGVGYKGMGAYTREGVSNDLVTGVSTVPTASSTPVFKTLPGEDGSLLVTYREYLCDVYGNESIDNNFVVNSIPMNPGLETSFPWLSQVASNFKEYEWKQCVFDFRSMITDMTTSNGQLGQVLMTTEYNVDAFPFEDKNEMLTTVHAVSGKVIDDITHGVECDPRKMSGSMGKYIRSKPVLIGEDKKEYDLANFQYAICDTPVSLSNLPIGQLYVSYTVLLRKARTYSARGNMISRYLVASPWLQSAILTSPTTKTYSPFGLTGVSTVGLATLFGQQNNFPCLFESSDINLSSLGTVSAANGDYKAVPAVIADVGNQLKNPFTNQPIVNFPAIAVPANIGMSLALYLTASQSNVSNRITFPSSFSGNVRVLIQMEVQLQAAAIVGDSFAIGIPFMRGNISCVKDMYGVSGGSVDQANEFVPIGLSRNVVSGNGLTQQRQLYLCMHIRIKPATGGVENQLIWSGRRGSSDCSADGGFTGPAAATAVPAQTAIAPHYTGNVGGNFIQGSGYNTVSASPDTDVNVIQASLDIMEYNPSFASSPSIPAPIFINRDGTATSVY